jgi:hypothetical protein
MERHCPEEVLMEADVKARVADASRGLASAAAEGLRMPPARETGRGVIGLLESLDGIAEAAGVGAGGTEEVSDTGDAVAEATAEDAEVAELTAEDAGGGAGAAAPPPSPKVNVWDALPAAHGA